MPRSTLAESVAFALRDAIYRGDYVSGERLVELSLSQELHVSQNTVRDALYLLEQQGLVVKNARRGVYLRTHTPAEAEEVYTLWQVIEGAALEWALPALTRDDHHALRGLLDEARQHVMVNSFLAATPLFTLHETLGRRADRPQTAAFLSNILNQARLLENLRQMRVPRSAHAREAQLEAHEHFLKYVTSGDVTGAQRCLADHLRTEYEALLAIMKG